MACEEFRDQMLDALYGEGPPASTREFDAHQQRCAECRDELRALRALRRDLQDWEVPASSRALRVRVLRWASAWLPLTAGVLLGIGSGLLLAGTRSDVRALSAALGEQELRHRAEIAVLQSKLAARPDGTAATIEEVRRLVRESEARQAVVLAASLRGMAERTEAQRREDLAQVNAGFTYLEGRTGLQVARTTELMGRVLQASQKK